MLNKKYFSKYESNTNTTTIPNNIVFMFTQGNCPNNFVCVDPNGVIVNSNENTINNVYLYNNEFDRLYIQRYKDIEMKKEIIINILYSSLHPFIGEVLFIAKMDNCTSLSMSNETEILKKYLMIMNHSYLPYINDSVEIVLSLVVNNTQFKLMLNHFFEGVCSVVDDQNSIHIFIEIIRTIIIHYVIQFHAINVNNIRGQITLLKILNNTFAYLPITKIRFVNELLMFDEIKEIGFEYPENVSKEDMKAIAELYIDMYNPSDDKDQWFSTMKDLAEKCGFCREVKEYKQNPDAFKGHVGDISSVIRVAVTGRMKSPDLWGILRTLGKEKVTERINSFIKTL
jgi:glutamyl/glutaminyl-tRNA synthetase